MINPRGVSLVIALAFVGLSLAECVASARAPLPTLDAQATESALAARILTASVPTATDTPGPTNTATITPNSVATLQLLNQSATNTAGACLHNTNLAPATWRVILCDPFDTNRSGWTVGNARDQYQVSKLQLTNGTYRWDNTALQPEITHVFPQINSLGDLYLTVLGQRLSGPAGAAYGVIFRYDGVNYYLFLIRDDQLFRVSKRYGAERTTLIDWNKSSAIRPGAANRITVKAVGGHLSFFINDQAVGTTDDKQLTAGSAGLVTELFNAGDSSTIAFDNFELRAP